MAPAPEGNPFTVEDAAPAEPRGESPARDEPPAGTPPPRAPRPLLGGLAFAWRMKRVLLLVVLVQLLFGLSIAAPLRSRLAAYFDRHPHAPAMAGEPDAYDRATGWAEGLDWTVLADIRRKEAPFLDGIGLALVWVSLLAWLFGQAASGGFLAAAAEDAARAAGGPPAGSAPPAGPRGLVSRFLSGAGRWFFPMARLSLVSLVLVEGIGRRAIFEAWGGIAGDTESRAASQATGWLGQREREAAFVALFLVFRAAADLGRAHLVVRGRRSALLAFGRGLWTLVRHPLRAGGLAVLVGVPEMLLLLSCASLLARFAGGTWWHLLGAFLVLQAAVLVRWWARAALLAGNVRLLMR